MKKGGTCNASIPNQTNSTSKQKGNAASCSDKKPYLAQRERLRGGGEKGGTAIYLGGY